jgi:protein-S-isoprenylcysteine O-methyltransferase Ste14
MMFKIVYFAGIVLQVIVRFPYERARRYIPKADQRVTPAEQGLLAALTLGMGVLPLVYSLTSWLDFADYRWSPGTKARIGGMGTALLAASVWLFWRSHHDLGINWSPSLEIGAQHELVTHGVYRKIRHPMYASQLLWGFAQVLLLHNWIAGLGGLVTFLPMYFVRMPQEERMMLEHFGGNYREYSARTGKILPRIQG